MVSQVRIENYQCLRNVGLDLGPFTVLVGPNASGKSAVLRALARRVSEGDRSHGAKGPHRGLVIGDPNTAQRLTGRTPPSQPGPGEAKQWVDGFGSSLREDLARSVDLDILAARSASFAQFSEALGRIPS